MNLDEMRADFRLADFKLLLPLAETETLRVLITHPHERGFLPHLAKEVGTIDILVTVQTETYWRETLTAFKLPGVRIVNVPDGEYDVVFSDDRRDSAPVRPGGWLCCFSQGTPSGPLNDALQHQGSWLSWPSWPDFRFLIPDTIPAHRAAARDFMIYPPHSPRSLLSRISPTRAARSGSNQHITLYRRDGPSIYLSFRERLAKVWSDCPELSSLREYPPDRWVLYSGRLGEGNPILLFLLDARGQPQVLVKVARFPGLPQLYEEERQLKAITERLDGAVKDKIIRPLASAELDGRPLLAYRFEPCFPFFGIRWRLTGRANYLRCGADWLAELAKQTRHVMVAAAFWEQHGEPLQRLLQRGVLPTYLAELATDAVRVLRDYQDKPFAVLEHGDLGFYNTRLTDRKRGDFKVLDWGSSDQDGAPLGDLCYLLASVNAPPQLAAECVGAYLDSIGYPRQISWMLWLSYMARRWEELDRVRPSSPDDPYPGGAILLHTTDLVRRYFSAMGV